jgi:hypothetical protein
MGAGILPTAIYKGKLYFLFGKENAYADTPGFSDFGGGTENGESFLTTAAREGSEELTGFLGSQKDVRQLMRRNGTYVINSNGYRMHLVPLAYDEALVCYYNNAQAFIQANLDPAIIQKVKIFEKAEIQWKSVAALSGMQQRGEFRSYFNAMVDMLKAEEQTIRRFIGQRSKTKVRSKSKTKSRSKTKTRSKSQTQTKSQTKSKTKSKTRSKSKTKSQTRSQKHTLKMI